MMVKKITITMLGLILVLMVFFLITGCYTLQKNKYPVPENISQSVIDLCEKQGRIGRFKCEDCADGFGEDCYFDTTEYNKDTLETGFTFPEETKKACFAVHSMKYCGAGLTAECYNLFKLRKENEFKEVSCEEFFQAIKDKNQSCNGCVDMLMSGCC